MVTAHVVAGCVNLLTTPTEVAVTVLHVDILLNVFPAVVTTVLPDSADGLLVNTDPPPVLLSAHAGLAMLPTAALLVLLLSACAG